MTALSLAPAMDLPARASAFAAAAAGLDAEQLLIAGIRREFPGRIALVSSFGAEAAVLLHMISRIDAATPVVFLDTGKLFGETLRYRDQLVARLKLTDVRSIKPDEAAITAADPDGLLWRSNPDRCCFIRKVEPLERALSSFDAWINGRKRYHGGSRSALAPVEFAEGRVKLNPLADWDAERIQAYFTQHDLPHHPLEEDGYRSIGCMPCSDRVAAGEDARAGRWRGSDKTECGIHMPLNAPAGRDE